MPNLNDIRDEYAELGTFKTIASAFAESSVVKLKNLRVGFDQNRSFYDEISHVYHLVKFNANKRKIPVPGTAVIAGNKIKTILIAVTSNLRFYGSLNADIMNKFIKESGKKGADVDLMVIGSTGNDYLKGTSFQKKYESMTFKADNPDEEEIQQFIERTKDYQSILLLYPKFFSLMSVMVGIVDITHTAVMQQHDITEDLECLFEPELFKILEFFERQVRHVLFLRVLLETELARTAARLIAMTGAEERSDALMREKRSEIIKISHSIINTQLLETFAGMKLWKR